MEITMITNKILKIQFENEEIDIFKDICEVCESVVDNFLQLSSCGLTNSGCSEDAEKSEQLKHSRKMKNLFDKIKLSVNKCE